MAAPRNYDDSTMRLIEYLQNDLKSLSIEAKKRNPHIKEACEESILKLRNCVTSQQFSINYVINQILYPVIEGCETRDPKIVKLCLTTIQRIITHQAVDPKGARFITETLWMLMENEIEEVKLLQTATLLLTTNGVVHGDTLAKNLVLCFRLHSSKDPTTANTAGATVRQLVSLVFERVVTEDEVIGRRDSELESTAGEIDIEQLKMPSSKPPKTLRPCAGDAYLMFQDLVQLINKDQPYWLNNLTDMTRTFGLELLESILVNFSSVFFKHKEFQFLLKERVCALVIKLFSPNVKFRNCTQVSNINHPAFMEKPYFPVSVRLLRVVSTLIQKYHQLLVTECEIFLSSIVKSIDPDKQVWQRAVALEVLHKLCIQPELLVSFCECYDLKTHTTDVFKDIVNCLGHYVQWSFSTTPFVQSNLNNAQISTTTAASTGPIGPGTSPQPGFFLKGIWLPLVASFPSGQTKSMCLEMMEKVDPPIIPDGYGISVAYACFLEVVQSLSLIIDKGLMKNRNTNVEDSPGGTSPEEKEKKLHCQLINSSWKGVLTALCLLIESSMDESVTENLLKAVQAYTNLAGKLHLYEPRDAFIIAICQAALPPNYVVSVTSSHADSEDEEEGILQYNITGYSGSELDYKQQVVAVGSPLPSTSCPGIVQGSVMLTAKNIQCMKALLVLAQCYGGVLDSAWLIVLTTVQHLVWILALKPTTGGSLKAGRITPDSNAVLTTAVMADLPILSNKLSGLFESSQYLSEVALHHLIDALCRLSNEAMELAYCNREPSLFAVAKLLETGLVNLCRVEVVWDPLTNHLLEICQHPHIRMREWGVEAITYLVKASLQYKYDPPLKENQKLQILLLSPLVHLSTIRYGDVRQRQLECVLNILHSSGELLSHGWPLILNIVGAISDHHGENLIRIAFQCLQLIVTDFLPLIPWRCLPLCLETTARFGSQVQELNISLTAIGLMWNIADYFYQNKDKLFQYLNSDRTIFFEYIDDERMPPFDRLWMCLYTKLSALCVDMRPAVRKSAGQTLFSTISAHGGLLSNDTWHSVLWKVLFPLLDKVRGMSSSASNKKVDAGGSILIHHTRNTAQKQWAETQVLTLSGVVRVFNAKKQLLQTLDDFLKAWSLLLEFIEYAALSTKHEVSLAALRSFQELLFVHDSFQSEESNTSVVVPNDEKTKIDMWNAVWEVWFNIATRSLYKSSNPDLDSCFPSQAFLSSLIHVFPTIFEHIRSRFTKEHLDKLCGVLESAAAAPVFTDTTPYYLPATENSMSPLQEGILGCIDMLKNNALSSPENMEKSICPIFKQLLSLCKYAYEPTQYTRKQVEQKFILLQREVLAINCVPFGEKAVAKVVTLYEQTAEQEPVIKGQILKAILEMLHIALSKQYDRGTYSTWKLLVASFMTVLSVGVPLARKYPESFQFMWPDLASCLEYLLFPKASLSAEKGSSQGIEQLVEDEGIDSRVIEFLKEEVLTYSSCIPKDFILKVVVLLNKGSILSPSHNTLIQRGSGVILREEFAKNCFETLLEFSLLDGLNNSEGESLTKLPNSDDEVTGRLAVTALLFRFQEVLKKYIQDENRAGKCPLPRHRLSEISFVLRAITTLVTSLKGSPEKVSTSVWEQVIKLYPHLVSCSITSSPQISEPLCAALHQYYDLLAPPSTSSPLTSSEQRE